MDNILDNINNIIEKIARDLSCVALAKQEGWWLLEKLTSKTKSQLISEENISLDDSQQKKLALWIKQRTEDQKPLQYILGTVPFCDLEIIVKPPILIPRPETEEWCSWLIGELEVVKDEKIKILDLGVGSGCIALALAKALPYSTVIGVDVDDKAIALSEQNKSHNNISNAIFIKSNLYQELLQHQNSFDLIVSNPPYISYDEYEGLSKQVTEWESKEALVAGEQGFSIHKKIITDANKFLKPNSILALNNLPRIVLEFGKGQALGIKEIFEHFGFTNTRVYKDMENTERWLASLTTPVRPETVRPE